MLQQFQTIISLAIALQALHYVPFAFAQQKTSGITLRVVDEKMRPVPWANVEVVAPDDSIVLSGEVANGKFEIADLGFGLHSLRIDKGSCSEVILKNIRFRMGSHFDVVAIRNPCPGMGDGFGHGCSVYFRVRGRGGAVTGAVATMGPHPQRLLADEYGRIEAAINANQRETFRISAEGYSPQVITLDCPQYARFEREVLLEP